MKHGKISYIIREIKNTAMQIPLSHLTYYKKDTSLKLSQKGFTLLEIIFATAICCMTIGIFLSVSTKTMDAIENSRNFNLAIMQAEQMSRQITNKLNPYPNPANPNYNPAYPDPILDFDEIETVYNNFHFDENYFNGNTLEDFSGIVYVSRINTQQLFIRGDANNDGRVNIADSIYIQSWFNNPNTYPEPPIMDAADVDDDGIINDTDGDGTVEDSQYLLDFLFTGGPQPPAPYPNIGQDPTSDALTNTPNALQIDIIICWRNGRNGRITGEDENLNGILDAGEDKAGGTAGIIDSPCHITNSMARSL